MYKEFIMSIFVDEVSKMIGLPLEEIRSEYKLMMVGSKMIRMSGYQKIISYQREKVILKIKNDTLLIEGKDLVIQEMEQNEIALVGQIDKIYLGSSGEK